MKLRGKRTVALALLVVGFLPVLAAAQRRDQPPQPGTPKNFAVPEVRRMALANGLRVGFVAFGNVPKVTIRAVVAAGKVYEGKNEVWLADLTGNLLREGTETLPSDVVAERFAGLGGALAIVVRPDVIAVSCEVLSDRGPEALQLIADVLQRPRFPESELRRVKGNLLRQLAMRGTTPEAAAEEKFRELIYADHPYSRIFPDERALNEYSIEQVRAFHRTNFTASRTRLYVAGVFDAAAIETAIRKAFDPWAQGSAATLPVLAEPGSSRFALVDRPNAPQSTLMLGLRVPGPTHADWIALEVTNALLGGGFSSRIVANIREQKGYTYSPDSMLSALSGQAHWVQTADVTARVTGLALKEILYEIERLRTEAPPEDELEGVKRHMVGSFLVRNASRAGIITQLAFVDLHRLAPDYLSDYVKRVMAVTPQDVRRIAREYLVPDRMSLVVVGDVKTIKDQIGGWSKR